MILLGIGWFSRVLNLVLAIQVTRLEMQRSRLRFVQGLGVLAFPMEILVARWTLVSDVFMWSRQSLFLIL